MDFPWSRDLGFGIRDPSSGSGTWDSGILLWGPFFGAHQSSRSWDCEVTVASKGGIIWPHGAQKEGTIFIDGYPSMIFIDGYPSMNINGYPVL